MSSPSAFLALTRDVPPAINRCELTHLAREPIDYHRAVAQHQAYERRLEELGCRLQRIPADPEQADAVFIEDTAVVVDELALITRPGAESRRSEVEPVAQALQRLRPVTRIRPPGTLDGGDVLRAGRQLFVGRTSRTNAQGIAQLREAMEPLGYSVIPVAVSGCLHLKSAVTEVDNGLLLINPRWVNPGVFAGFDCVEVDPAEPHGANVLRVGDRVLHGEPYSRTRSRLEAEGVNVVAVDLSELAKAEGAVTCCSLILSS
jgi:dimethylargininase